MLRLGWVLLLLLGSALRWWLRILPRILPHGLHLRQLDPALRSATCRLQDVSGFEAKTGMWGLYRAGAYNPFLLLFGDEYPSSCWRSG